MLMFGNTKKENEKLNMMIFLTELYAHISYDIRTDIKSKKNYSVLALKFNSS